MLGTDSIQQSLIVVVTKDSVSQVVSDLLIQFCYLLLVEFRLKFDSLRWQRQRLLEEFLKFLAELPDASSLCLGDLDRIANQVRQAFLLRYFVKLLAIVTLSPVTNHYARE